MSLKRNLMGHSCSHPSCNQIVRTKYCDVHKHIQSTISRETRGTTTQQGYGTTWQKIRARHLSLYPLCEDCKSQGIIHPANEVHHIKELKRGGTNDDNNLQSLCKPCHSKRTKTGKGAIGNKHTSRHDGNVLDG